MGDFLRVSQTPVSIMAHHILNFVEAAHSLCGVEVSPQWFCLNPCWGGPRRCCPLGSSHPIWAPAPCSEVLKPTSYCSSLSALSGTIGKWGWGREKLAYPRGPLIKILKRPSKNMSAVTCTSVCIFYIFYVLISSLPNWKLLFMFKHPSGYK